MNAYQLVYLICCYRILFVLFYKVEFQKISDVAKISGFELQNFSLFSRRIHMLCWKYYITTTCCFVKKKISIVLVINQFVSLVFVVIATFSVIWYGYGLFVKLHLLCLFQCVCITVHYNIFCSFCSKGSIIVKKIIKKKRFFLHSHNRYWILKPDINPTPCN